jgi:pyruvate formate-lyase activating enzyme-like uncharacterized protein
MTREMIKALSDAELEEVGIWAREETKERVTRHKQETIAKMKALAAEVGVSIRIDGTRGRSAKAATQANAIKPKR